MELQHRLQSLLNAEFRLERELGGGGMSRVFLATERKLGRRVVIKVLSSELSATLSTDRFAREIQLAASLQQANIVSVLTAGMADDMPYFTMPFIEGESLRARLSRGPMPEAAAVSVLRDVTRALIYAHERGVVHRDIKPDNILLSGESAMVTDFGIAKAIDAAREGGRSDTITQVGTALGTPAYMAPEQAAGDPGTDYRADLYALGCVAFELLTGQTPFHGRQLHQLLRAHMTESAPSVRSRVPSVSPRLDSFVAQCLAKAPEERPRSARDVLRTLDAVAVTDLRVERQRSLPAVIAAWAGASGAAWVLARAAVVGIGLPSWTVPLVLIVAALGLPAVLLTWLVQRTASLAARGMPAVIPDRSAIARIGTQGAITLVAMKASAHVSWRRTRMSGYLAGGAVVVVLSVVLILRQFGIGPAASLLAAGRVQAESRILVAEFTATTSDSSLGSVLAQAMRSSLSQSSAVQLVSTSDVASALRRMTLASNTRLTGQTALELAQRNRIPLVITGQITAVGTGFLISADIVRSDSATVLSTLQHGARGADDLLDAVDKVARDVRSRLGESLRSVARAPALEEVTTSSLSALRAYTRGVQLGDAEGNWAAGLAQMQEAVRIDSTFAQAWRRVSAYAYNLGRPLSERVNAAMSAYRHRERLPEGERLEVEAYYSYLVVGDKPAIEAYTRSPNVFQGNRTNALAHLGRFAEADSLLLALRSADSAHGRPSVIQLYQNRLLYQIALRQFGNARRLVGEMTQRFPGSVQVELGLAWLAWGEFGMDSLSSTAARLQRSQQPRATALGAMMSASDAGARGQLRAFEQREQAARAAGAMVTGSDDAMSAAVWTLVPTAIHRNQEARGVVALDSLLKQYSQYGRPAPDRADLALAIAYAQLGRADKAKSLVTQWTKEADLVARLVRWADWHGALGEVALAEGRATEAINEFRVAANADSGRIEPVNSGLTPPRMARAFDRAGQVDSAVTWYELVANVRYDDTFRAAPLNLPVAYRRLGELYEAGGDTAKALDNYRAFTKLWANADVELQPQVSDVKKRIERLLAAEARKR